MKYSLVVLLLCGALALPPSWGLFSGALRFDGATQAAAAAGGLSVPLVSQYQGLATDNVNCGPAAVAAIVRALRPSAEELSDAVLVGRARAASGGVGDTSLRDLARALTAAGVPNAVLYADDQPDGTGDPLGAVTYAVQHGSPILALVNGADLGRGPRYGDHWLVISAVDTGAGRVRVVDPDTQQARLPDWIAGGTVWLPSWRVGAALRDASPGSAIVALAAGADRGSVPSPRLVLPPLAGLVLLWQARGRVLRMLSRRWRKRLRRWAGKALLVAQHDQRLLARSRQR